MSFGGHFTPAHIFVLVLSDYQLELSLSLMKRSRSWAAEPSAKNVLIIGAGPAGLDSSLLLSKFKIPHLLVEEGEHPLEHPQPHFINRRSMKIFSEPDRLDGEMRSRTTSLDEWRRFVYCANIVELPVRGQQQQGDSRSLLVEVEHFPHGPGRQHSPTWICHFPQHSLLRLLRDRALKQDFCTLLEGHRASV